MLDLNFFFKIFYISANLISGFVHIIIIPIIIYLLTKYFETNFCGDLILFYLINSIFLIPVTILHCISIFFIICDSGDLFGKGAFVSLIGIPIYLLNTGLGTYFKFIKTQSKTCIQNSYDVNYLLGFTFNFVYYFSLFASICYVLLFSLRIYLSKRIIPTYKNTIYYEEHLKLLEEEEKKETEEKKKDDEKYEIYRNKTSMDPFNKLDINKANIINIK